MKHYILVSTILFYWNSYAITNRAINTGNRVFLWCVFFDANCLKGIGHRAVI